MNIDSKILSELNDKIDFIIIGHNATSYKSPLIVKSITEYEDKICIETQQIKGKYIVFDKNSFITITKKFMENKNNNENKKT